MEAVKSFYKFLLVEEKIQDDPTRFLKSPKLSQKIPTQLTREEMDRLLSYPAEKFDEIRTVTIIELLYAAGLRVSELINLRLENVNLVEKWVLALGKGGKQRFVPIHDRAAERIKQYLSAREAHFAAKDVDSELFLNKKPRICLERPCSIRTQSQYFPTAPPAPLPPHLCFASVARRCRFKEFAGNAGPR